MIRTARVLPFDPEPDAAESRISRVHRVGSITFRAKVYATIQQVPPEYQALLPDQETYTEWKRLYRAIAP